MIWEDAEFSRLACQVTRSASATGGGRIAAGSGDAHMCDACACCGGCLQWLVHGLEQASYDAVSAYWKCIRAVITVDDSLRLRRVAMVLGDPLIGTVAAGAGLGLPPLEVPAGADVVPPEAERQRREELVGIGKGVLTVMRSRRTTNERMVYNSLKELLALAQGVPAIVEYMSRLPPEDPLNEDRYTDWMFSFLHKHTANNATVRWRASHRTPARACCHKCCSRDTPAQAVVYTGLHANPGSANAAVVRCRHIPVVREV